MIVACAERPPARQTATIGWSFFSSCVRPDELAERDQHGAGDAAQGAGELVGLAHVEHLHTVPRCSSTQCGWISQMPAKLQESGAQSGSAIG